MTYNSPPSYHKPVSLELESRWAEAILTLHENARLNLDYALDMPSYDFSLRSTHLAATVDLTQNRISINRILAELNDTEESINFSVANELAHLINQAKNGNQETYSSWQKIVVSLGETPNNASYKTAGGNSVRTNNLGVMPFVTVRQ